MTNGCAWNAVSAFANCGRAVAHVRGSYMQITANHRSWAPTGLPLDNLVSYLGVDGMAEEWWSTISQRSPFLT